MSSKRILIVEDEFIIAQSLMKMLGNLGYAIAGHAFDAAEALQILAQNGADIALLDITLGHGMDGIALAAQIREQYGIPYLFLTSHSDSATIQRAKETRPAGFLVKPFKEADIHAGIEIALAQVPASAVPDHIYIKVGNELRKVQLSDIVLLEADRVYVEIHRVSGPPLIVRESLGQWEEKLPEHFLRIHRSHIINVHHVESIGTTQVVVGGRTLSLTRQAREELMRRIQNHG